MVDIVYDQIATERRDSQGLVAGKGDSHTLKCITAVREVPATSQNATIKFMRIPANARLSYLSRIYWDDLTSSNSPTLDFGLASVDANITSDPDALSNGHDVTSADLSGQPLLDLIETAGDYAWEFVNGVTVDPGGELDVYCTIVDAATSGLTGTVVVDLYYTLD